MTFVDADYFVRAIVEPTSETLARHETAIALFRAVARGEEEATTAEAVLAEVSFVLNSKRQYGLPPAEVAARLTPILALPSLSLPRGRKHLYLRALELWSERPRLGFVDALTVAEVEHTGIPLATFDRDFGGIPGITYWRPTPEGEAE